MREQFPALCHALGEPLFNDFVAEYIRERPPESHTLYDLGRRFPAFLDESRPDRDQPPEEREAWIDFMIDLARFERQMFVMFDAPGHEGKPFATPETPDARLRLQPAFAIGAYRFPVAAYYHAVRQKQPAELPPAEASYAALVRTAYVTRTARAERARPSFPEGDGRRRRCRRRDRRRGAASRGVTGRRAAIVGLGAGQPAALDRLRLLHRSPTSE